MEGGERAWSTAVGLSVEERARSNGAWLKREDTSDSATTSGSKTNSPASSLSPDDAKSAGDGTIPEDGTAPKLSRKTSQKMARNPPLLFDRLPDATQDACTTFQVISDCLYGSRNMGSSDHDALDCDCAEDWRKWPSPKAPVCL